MPRRAGRSLAVVAGVVAIAVPISRTPFSSLEVSWSLTVMPESGVLALLGVGLISLGLALRQGKAARRSSPDRDAQNDVS